MKFFVAASLVAAAAAAPPPNKIMLFENFIKKFEPNYDGDFEKGQRFQIFSENVDMIYASNANNKSYTLGITANADKTFEEWRAIYLTGFKPALTAEKKDRAIFHAPKAFSVPDSVDWVAKGGVTSVKNQGTCGSCWTFSTVGALEGAMATSGRKMVDLSMQHILACDTGGAGCKGGSMDQAFDWVGQNGVSALSDEPYLCKDASDSQCTGMTCSKSAEMVIAVGDVAKHTDVAQTENALEAAVAQQPVSVAIEADQAVFQHYTGGVLTNEACGSNLDHGVLAVGYGVDNGQKYWKVKNSWGTTFGEEGYIRIEKGDAASGGECGIRKGAVFPTLNKEVEFVQGGTLKLTWKDCGDSTYHAKVTDVEPKDLPLGKKTSVVGSGTTDEQVTGGAFTIDAKFGPVTENWSGDVCTAKTFKLPLGLGTVKWDGIACPTTAGKVSVGVDVSLSGFIPASAASGTIAIKATDAKKGNLICLTLDIAKAVSETIVV